MRVNGIEKKQYLVPMQPEINETKRSIRSDSMMNSFVRILTNSISIAIAVDQLE